MSEVHEYRVVMETAQGGETQEVPIRIDVTDHLSTLLTKVMGAQAVEAMFHKVWESASAEQKQEISDAVIGHIRKRVEDQGNWDIRHQAEYAVKRIAKEQADKLAQEQEEEIQRRVEEGLKAAVDKGVNCIIDQVTKNVLKNFKRQIEKVQWSMR